MEQESSFPKDLPTPEGLEKMQRELERMADESHKALRRYESPLPPVLYHVTTKENAAKILREGLRSALRLHGDRKVVSLSDDIAFAKGVVKETQQTENRDNLVVLRIDTQWLDRELAESFLEDRVKDVAGKETLKALQEGDLQKLEEFLHEVHYEAAIPPKAISVHREGEDLNADWKQRRERRAEQEEMRRMREEGVFD